MKKISLFIGLTFLLCACEEHDLGVSKEVLYQKTFEQEFGQIAPGHQWGFDVAEAAFQFQNNITRAIIKADMNVEGTNLRPWQIFGKAPDITQKEHDEVLAWFSNHKVNWTNTPTHFEGTPTNQTSDNTAHVIDASYPCYGSLTSHAENVLGDYEMNAELLFYHGWIQHVAKNDRLEEVVMKPEGASDSNNYWDATTGQWINTTFDHNKANDMDYLRCWSLETEGWSDHILDFNAAQGWGWQMTQGTLNAILITYTDIDRWTYGCSDGSSWPHDKYYIVHLKGEDYEGWYMGMDFESDGENTRSRIYADGICNDWIIKISDIGNMITSVKFRVMCEDLGGTFDMDFNDIVYDVEFSSQGVLTVTMQAEGGTLPIRMQYGDYVLKKNNKEDIHDICGISLSNPINVIKPNGATHGPVTWTIAFPGTQDDVARQCDVDWSKRDDIDFRLKDLNVYVRQEDKAEWVELSNIEGAAPYKFAVPIIDDYAPKWMIELTHISKGYPDFMAWVNNPTVEFWNNPQSTDPETGKATLY